MPEEYLHMPEEYLHMPFTTKPADAV